MKSIAFVKYGICIWLPVPALLLVYSLEIDGNTCPGKAEVPKAQSVFVACHKLPFSVTQRKNTQPTKSGENVVGVDIAPQSKASIS